MTVTPTPPNTAHGTAPTAPATKSSASPCLTATLTAAMKTFSTGFLPKNGQAWGRPVAVAIAEDGSMFATDDGSRSVWHFTYAGN